METNTELPARIQGATEIMGSEITLFPYQPTLFAPYYPSYGGSGGSSPFCTTFPGSWSGQPQNFDLTLVSGDSLSIDLPPIYDIQEPGFDLQDLANGFWGADIWTAALTAQQASTMSCRGLYAATPPTLVTSLGVKATYNAPPVLPPPLNQMAIPAYIGLQLFEDAITGDPTLDYIWSLYSIHTDTASGQRMTRTWFTGDVTFLDLGAKPAPAADFTYTADSVAAHLVHFVATWQNSPTADYVWSGDLTSPPAGPMLDYQFSAAGTYDVTLTVVLAQPPSTTQTITVS
jgi:hypothetical protein